MNWVIAYSSCALQPVSSQDSFISAEQLQQRLKADYASLRAKQEVARRLNPLRCRQGRSPLTVPTLAWGHEHALSLVATVLPMLKGVEVVGIDLASQEIGMRREGSPQILGLRVCSYSSQAGMHLVVTKPPVTAHWVPVVVAVSQVLNRPVQPEIAQGLARLQELRGIYPLGSHLRDNQVHKLFSAMQLQAFGKLRLLVKYGRYYCLR